MPAPADLPQRILSGHRAWPLHDAAASRAVEADALARHPPRALMRRAGLGVARLALAVAPHAQRIWVAAGPGNNGGDGLVAASHLHGLGRTVQVGLFGDPARLPPDAAQALADAQAAGVPIDSALPQAAPDLAIDALLGLGTARAPQGAIADAITRLNGCGAPCLAVDLPTGLHPDTGQPLGAQVVRARHTLALLTLKPGLVTGAGRDFAGDVWLDPLGVDLTGWPTPLRLAGAAELQLALPARRHAAHKGSFGDLAVVGGAGGMTGAAWLAARAALGAGAGRVFVDLLGGGVEAAFDPLRPELMLRPGWWRGPAPAIARSTVVCGCGGGGAVREALPALLSRCPRLVLDADALNQIAADPALQAQLAARAARGLGTVLTPHPLEAARLLGSEAAAVQADRLGAARRLAEAARCTVLLKGSGSIVAALDGRTIVNPTGNALLSTGGTGDVLAGWIGGLWSQQPRREADAAHVAAGAAWLHGHAADVEAARRGAGAPLRAADLIEAMHALQAAAHDLPA
jgi:hydroxyethylthiazole kinase-like uncharacterized protein yjeF